MKLFGGSGKRGSLSFYDRLGNKGRVIIGFFLIVIAVIMTAAALATRQVKPPEPSDLTESQNTSNSQDEGAGEENLGRIEIEDSRRKSDFFTVLLIGTDYYNWNTDTLMLAAFDITTKKLSVMSLPRDTRIDVNRANKKINAAYTVGGKSGNIKQLYSEVESVVGFKPDRYAVISLQGFIDMIDAIGGVTIDVPINMVYNDPTQDLKINIKKGLQTLNGYDAMGFMRYRDTYVEGDIGRIKVQHTFVEAFAKKMISPATLSKIPRLADIAIKNVETDLTMGNLIWLGKECLSLDAQNDVRFFTLPGAGKYIGGLSYYVVNKEKTEELVNEYFNPYVSPINLG